MIARNASRWSCLCGLALVGSHLAGCSPKPGKLVTHEAICNAENNQQRVTIEGYLTVGSMLTFCSRGTCSLDLRKNKQGEKPVLTVGIRPGSGRNRMAELPENFGPRDLQFTTNEGKKVGDLAHVRVTGRVLAGEGCQLLDVDLIEGVNE